MKCTRLFKIIIERCVVLCCVVWCVVRGGLLTLWKVSESRRKRKSKKQEEEEEEGLNK